MKPKKEKAFATEVDLCRAFLADIGPDWTAYAETCGWDILLVRKIDGFQIGIEAKLRLNVQVLSQALESDWPRDIGPDCRAVLVPYGGNAGLSGLAHHCGIEVINVRAPGKYKYYRNRDFDPGLPELDDRPYRAGHDWPETPFLRRHQLPEYVPDVAAGASAPTQLTAWKISAIKIAVTLELRGFVTRYDFKHHGIDHRRWIAPGYQWLLFDRQRRGYYTAGPRIAVFKAQHPKVYAEIMADAEKWMPPIELAAPLPAQQAML